MARGDGNAQRARTKVQRQAVAGKRDQGLRVTGTERAKWKKLSAKERAD
jgi:hypothetical protein